MWLYICTAIQIFLRLFHNENLLHQDRFARPEEIYKQRTPKPNPKSILLGKLKGGDFVAVHATTTRPELGNLLVVGRTRSGKGLNIDSQLLNWEDSAIVNDPKGGEAYDHTAKFRSGLGRIIAFNPEGKGHRFDPFHNNKTEDDFLNSATLLLQHGDEGQNFIFTKRAIVMLTQIFLASRKKGIPPLLYVRYLTRLGLANAAARLNDVSTSLATRFLDIDFARADFKDKFLRNCWETLTTLMEPLLTETVIRSLTHSDFTPEEILCGDKPVTVYLMWPERKLTALAPLVRLMFGTLMDELYDVYDKRKGKGCWRLLLPIDEAGRTKIPMLSEYSTTCVGRKMSLLVFVQSLSQLEAEYGRARAQTLRDNMDSQIFYRPTDLQTANFLEERLGTRSGFAQSHTTRDGEETSQGLAERPIPLLSSQEILQLPDEDIIAIHSNLPPMRLMRVDWRQHPFLKQKRNMTAPELRTLPPLPDLDLEGESPSLDDFIDPDELENRSRIVTA